jgi:PAS domain S-box-containing protein
VNPSDEISQSPPGGVSHDPDELFSKAFRLSPDCVVVTRVSDRTVVNANEALCRMWGGTLAGVIGKPTKEFSVWVSDAERDTFMERLLRDGEVLDWETNMRLNDGRLLRMRVSSRILTLKGEECILSVLRDVTEKRRAQEQVRVQQNLLQTVFENMAEGVAVLGATLNLVHMNPAFRRLLEAPPAATTWREVMAGLELFLPDGRILEQAQYPSLRAQRGDFVSNFAMGVRRANGPWEIFTEITTAPISPAPDGTAQFVITVRDVTDRRRAEAEVKLSEQRMRATLDKMMEGCQIIGRDWRYLYLNAVAAAPGRREVSELLGRTMMEAYPGIEKTPLFATLRRCMEARIPSSLENTFEVPGEPSAVFLLEVLPAPEGILVLSVDVTERRRAERVVRDLNADLERRVRERTAELEAANQELEAFSYSISHDLRSPLRSIDGFAHAVVEDYAALLPEEGRQFLQAIRDSARRMGALIEDLLTFSRFSRQPLDRQPVAAESQVRSVLAGLLAAGSRAEVVVGSLPGYEGDEALVRQVWVNLLSNALKYSAKRDRPRVEIGSTEESGEPVYFVRDNGAGFDMRYAHKLFGVFQRLHRPEEFEGTGVGLAVAQRVVRRHGGRIWAEAEVDRGATFFFTLAAPPAGPEAGQ